MTTLKTLTVAAAALMLTAVYSPTTSQARWYMGHSGAEICVPVDDLDVKSGKRLYYGAGPFKTPEDIAHWFHSGGFRMTRQPGFPEAITAYKTSGPGVRETMFLFFEDKTLCQTIMENLEK
jgi:hypothetical protein